MFARRLSKSRGTGLGRAGPGKCGAHNYHPGSTRLIVELSASRVPRRADSSNYQPDSSNYQLQADNPADNQAVSFVVYYKLASPRKDFFLPAFVTRILTPRSRKSGY